MSVPGPNARQFWELPPHVEFEKSQSIPVSLHLGPLIFGDTSPEFDEANAATNGPCSDILFLIKLIQFTSYVWFISFGRASNVEIGVECQTFVIVTFFNCD